MMLYDHHTAYDVWHSTVIDIQSGAVIMASMDGQMQNWLGAFIQDYDYTKWGRQVEINDWER